MRSYTPTLLEFGAMILIWLLAALAAYPLRRRRHVQDEAPQALSVALRAILASLGLPVLVLVFTLIMVPIISTLPSVAVWLASHENHLTAWQIFWVCLASFALIESVAQALFSWRRRTFPIPDLLLNILRGILVVTVALLVLRVELGINIGPLLASTALLTAVAGFALQGVLGNLMAGMSLHLVRTLKPGIWVDIEGIEGRILKTNWRETRIRTRGGYLYIIPNAKIAEAKIHNYAEPTPLRRHVINVGASYSDAPDEVTAAMVTAARAVPEVRSMPAPEAMITEFQDYGVNYRLEFWTTELHRHHPIDGAVNRMIWYQFKRHGIEIPFPMSDKLLNDFMAVVYNQRRLPPEPRDITRTIDDLLRSNLCAKLLRDKNGEALVERQDLEKLAPLVARLLYTDGETLCAQGDGGETFWVIASGKLKGTVSHTGKTAAEFELASGSVVGEMSCLTGMPRSATLKTTTGTELLAFDLPAFKTLLGLHPEIPERLADLAAARSAENQASLDAFAKSQDQGGKIDLEKPGILGRLKRIMGM